MSSVFNSVAIAGEPLALDGAVDALGGAGDAEIGVVRGTVRHTDPGELSHPRLADGDCITISRVGALLGEVFNV